MGYNQPDQRKAGYDLNYGIASNPIDNLAPIILSEKKNTLNRMYFKLNSSPDGFDFWTDLTYGKVSPQV